jgi:geranylgeranyl reductase family protein
MRSSDTYDAIVVGAGPAGAMSAYELGRRGLRVLLLEKEPLPRYKACAGGLTARVLRLLPFPVTDVLEAEVTSLRLSVRSRPGVSFARSYPQPFAYMVMRDRFDHYLVQRAAEAGAQVLDQMPCQTVEPDGGRVAVKAGGHWFSARAVLGADGALSRVARVLGLMTDARRHAALEAEVRVDPEVLDAYNGTVGIELGTRGSYGWIFPKAGHLSVGLEVSPGQSAARRELQAYIARTGIGAVPHLTKGHLLVFRQPGSPIARGRVMLVGEAAGLVDMFTGEGIYFALWSGRLAGSWLAQALLEDDLDARSYEELIDRQIMPELLHGRIFYSIFKLWPVFFYTIMRVSDRFWGAFCRLQRGELTYAGVRRRLGTFEPIFRVVEALLSRSPAGQPR